MEHLPKLEKPDRKDWNREIRLAARIGKRMERGNLSLILASMLPFLCLVFLRDLSVMDLAGFVLYELALVAGVAWGTKQYYRLYSLPGRKYRSDTHYLFQFLCGLAAAAMVLFPTAGFIVVLIWAGILACSLFLRFFRKEREQMWQEAAIEFAMAVRAGYLVCLVVCLLISVVIAAVAQVRAGL